MSELKHDLKNGLASMKAVIYLARRQMEEGKKEGAIKYLKKLDAKINQLNLLLDGITETTN